MKVISGRRFDGETKLWCFPDDPAVAERILLTVRPTADEALLQWVRNSKAERDAELTTKLPDDAALQLPWADKLYAHQRSAVDCITGHKHVLLADEPGVGKTLEALAAVAEYQLRNNVPDGPKLVVCPASIREVWAREIVQWLGANEPYVVVDGNTAKARDKQLLEGVKANAYCIVNYEQVRITKTTVPRQVNHRDGTVSTREDVVYALKQPRFETTPWLAVIADEVHRIKNRKAAQTQGMWRIHAPLQLGLSGTPVQNQPDELWSILKWLYPEQYGKSDKTHLRTPYWTFFDNYVDSYEGWGGTKVIVGVRNPDGLRFELKDRLVRRTKSQVLTLPEKTREIIPVTLTPSQRKTYRDAEKDFWLQIEQAVKSGDKSTAQWAQSILSGDKKIYEVSSGAVRTVRLRQVCSTPALLGGADDSAKLDTAVDLIVDRGEQIVVFTEFVGTCHALVERLARKKISARAFTGEVATVDRMKMIEEFQLGALDVIVGTIPSVGEGVTLTAASTAIFIERSWTPSKSEQCEDRLHRVGQKNAVTILILQATDTVDDGRVAPTETLKRSIVSSVMHVDEVREVV